jgi:hypothetical protein
MMLVMKNQKLLGVVVTSRLSPVPEAFENSLAALLFGALQTKNKIDLNWLHEKLWI